MLELVLLVYLYCFILLAFKLAEEED